MNTVNKEDNLKKKWSIIGGIAIILLWAVSTIIILKILPDTQDHGTFGDLFGAVNALFSGLVFLGVLIVILLQRQELKLQREKLEQTRFELQGQKEQAELQNFELTFINLLKNYLDLGNSPQIQESLGNHFNNELRNTFQKRSNNNFNLRKYFNLS